MNSRRFCLSLVVFLLVVFSAWGEDHDPAEMSDAEILTELIQNLEAREKALNERETLLSERKILLDERASLLTEREQSLIAIETFSQSLRSELKATKRTDFWRGFGVGSALGLAAGGIGGIYIGGSISF